jgi:hypothetical protein
MATSSSTPISTTLTDVTFLERRETVRSLSAVGVETCEDIAEPILSSGGIIELPEGYLAALKGNASNAACC